jgi:hypothetical protein
MAYHAFRYYYVCPAVCYHNETDFACAPMRVARSLRWSGTDQIVLVLLRSVTPL